MRALAIVATVSSAISACTTIGPQSPTVNDVAKEMVSASQYAAPHNGKWNPPPRFDKPWEGKLVVQYLEKHSLIAVCTRRLRSVGISYNAPYNASLRGCSVKYEDEPETCYVWINEELPQYPLSVTTRKDVERHEIGHCQGWNAEHSNE